MRISDWSSDVCSSDLAFSGLGLRVVGFNFRRDKFAPGFQPFWENVHLGTTQDRAYGRRLLALLGALPRVLRHRQELRQADFLYARNIDMGARSEERRVGTSVSVRVDLGGRRIIKQQININLHD